MSGIWNNKFEIVLRPLRDRGGPQATVVIETRTAAQATREVTARYPEMKVISVTRVTPTVASIKAAQRAVADVDPASQEHGTGEQPAASANSAVVVPLRRVS